MEEAADKAVKALSSCLCCLVNSPAKYLKSSYVHQEKTEIYIDMLKECLDIRIDIDSNACGICEECVGRLRDAINFKQQVHRCQTKLRKLITKAVRLLEAEPEVKSEIADDDNMSDSLRVRQDGDPPAKMTVRDGASEDFVLCDADDVRPETDDADATGAEDEVKLEIADADAAGGDATGSAAVSAECARSVRARAREQLAMTCVVRLERLRQSQCRARHVAVATDQEASPTTHVKDMRHDSLGAHTQSERGAAHRCGVCGHTFKTKSSLIIHIRVHTGEKPYSCDVCNKRFTQKSNLAYHIRTHTGERPHSCDICNKRFTSKGSLTYHIRSHAGEKSYKCNVCNKRFSTKQKLTHHIRIHTGHKPYSCDICNKRFIRKEALTAHIRTHTGQGPHRCVICNKRFTQVNILRRHITTHTGQKPYSCDICKKRFIQKSYMAYHIRTHTGEKPYKCNVCNKRHMTQQNLTSHIRIHTGQKPYSCDICNKRYTSKGSLTYHIRKHHARNLTNVMRVTNVSQLNTV